MNLTKVFNSGLNRLGQRFIKVVRFGRDDVQTPLQATPHGIDSNPVRDMVAVYSETTAKGDKVIVGYLLKNQLAGIGETRIFSTDSNGVLKAHAWLKADGTIEFNGSTENLVKWAALNTSLQQQVADINAELVKIATGLNAIVPLSYTPAPIVLDVTGAKDERLKTL